MVQGPHHPSTPLVPRHLVGFFRRDPVLAADGWTYERRALEKYMARPSCHGLPKSPASQLPPWKATESHGGLEVAKRSGFMIFVLVSFFHDF